MKIVLMHGKDTDPREKWYPWLAEEMQKRGVKFIAPALPNADDPMLDEWLTELDKTDPDEDTILIGHSRGGVAILRWIEKQSEEKRVGKIILVATNAGSSEKMNKTENNRGFYTEAGYNFEKIKAHCDEFVVLHSTDDKWVPFSAGVENAHGLNATFLKFEDKGHFGTSSGVYEIPELLKELDC